MTYESAADILDTETRASTLNAIGYYAGFNSDNAKIDAFNEACRLAAEILRKKAKEIPYATIYDFVEYWHTHSGINVSLKDFLGMSDKEYEEWAKGTINDKSKWISVKSKLPTLPNDNYCRVIVITCKEGDNTSRPMYYERALVRGKCVERWKYHWDTIVYPYDIPDYWMSMPEPPESEE